MVRQNASPNSPHRKAFADRVTASVADILQSEADPRIHSTQARIVGDLAAVIADLPPDVWREISSRRDEFGRRVRRLIETFGSERPSQIAISMPEAVEPSRGEGVGRLVTAEDGEEALDALAEPRRLEDWAGPVAGANELSRDFGIARSTLHRWQQAGDVVGLLKGTRKHVFPIAQFVDGRPARGLGDVIRCAANERIAWLWLSQPNPVLGSKPIDLLRRDRSAEVIAAAKSYFGAQ